MGTRKKTPTQLEADLKRLASEGQSNLYQRLTIAATLLADTAWLSHHGGSLDAAEEYVADKYFTEYRGLISFAKLHACFVKYDEATWKEYRYDVAAIESLYDESIEPEKQTKVRKSYKAECEDVTSKLAEAKARLATIERMEVESRNKVHSQDERIRELEQENAELRGRVAELERVLKRELVS